MKKDYRKILFISTIVLLTLVMVQTLTSFINLRSLKGAMVKAEMPKLTYRSYVDGSFQRGFEAYGQDNFGFREWLIRLYNQYLWSCYKKTSNNYILFGVDNWLYESDFVEDHYQSMMYKYTDDPEVMRNTFETEALRLWKVQELLKEYDIHIFVNMIPGKDVIYPENLPENTNYFMPNGIHAYDFYKKRFDELGINYIDNVTIFENIKDSVDYQLFTKTGTHWSNIASVHVFDSIIKYMEFIGDKNLNNIEIGPAYIDKTREPDDDLEQLLNLSFRIKSKPNLYADVKVIDDTTAIKPYLTTIGDSYYWNFIYNIPLNDIFTKAPYWYYNSTIYCDELNHSTLDIDFDQELMRTDFIMLNYCTVQIYKLGNNFISKALTHLCYDKRQIDAVADRIIESIKSNQEWYANIVEKAKNNNVSVERELYENAIYVINLEPEKYFPELKGNNLPVSRNKDLMAFRKNLKNDGTTDELQNMINYIYSDEEWLNKLKEKAQKNSITLDEQVELDARWMLSNK